MEIDLLNKKEKRKTSIIIEQYKIICESADSITDKRQSANNFYLTINSFFLSVAGYFSAEQPYTTITICIIGFSISCLWHQNIESYKQLNSAKFKIIHEIEELLPLRIFKKEEQLLHKKYSKLTSLEKNIPVLFLFFYATIFLFTIIKFLVHFFHL